MCDQHSHLLGRSYVSVQEGVGVASQTVGPLACVWKLSLQSKPAPWPYRIQLRGVAGVGELMETGGPKAPPCSVPQLSDYLHFLEEETCSCFLSTSCALWRQHFDLWRA